MRIEYCEPEGYYLLGQGQYVGITADVVLNRFKTATGTRAVVELAGWLGVRQSQISNVKRRNIFPAKWLHLLLEKRTHYNPVWVLTGEGETYTEEWWYTVAGFTSSDSSMLQLLSEPGVTAAR